MKQLLLATVAVLLAASATAEECVSKTEPHEGTSYETCMARVDDVIRVSVDGYVAQHYIVQYRGQRLVVFDPLVSDHPAGDQVSFTVMKLEEPASSRSRGFRALLAQTTFASKPASEHSRP